MNYNFNNEAREQVRQRADIGTIIGRYVNLKGRGGTLIGLCPFHNEKTPSFTVNPSRGFYHCFGCGKGGDVFNFIQEIESVDFREALEMLAEETGVRLERPKKDDRYYGAPPPSYEYPSSEEWPTASQNRKELLAIHNDAAGYYYRCLKNHAQAKNYFISRELSGKTAKEFSLGYAPDGWSGLLDYLRGKKYTDAQIIASGLVIYKKDKGSIYDRFRDRVMFPLYNQRGDIIAFAGRGMNADAQPKYLNSPETDLYKKSSVLYGIHKSRKSIHDLGCLLIVEGYMDYLTLYQAGIHNAAAVSGTAFTPDHAQMIKRFAQKAVLVFDGDRAGRAAAQRAAFVLAPVNVQVSVLTLPGDDDPDSFVRREGADAFLKLVAAAKPAADFLIDKLVSESDGSPNGKSEIVNELMPYARALSDTIVRDDFLAKLARRLNINHKIVLERFNSSKSYLSPNDSAAAPPASGFRGGSVLRAPEERFLRILITRPELITKARQHVPPETLVDSLAVNIYSIILEIHARDGSLNGLAEAYSNNPDIRNALPMLATKSMPMENIEEELVLQISILCDKFITSRMSEITEALNNCPNEEKSELLARQTDYIAQREAWRRIRKT